MRRVFTLTNLNPSFSVELTFLPTTIIVLNNTDQSVYLRIGSTDVPSATFFDREILPTASGIPSNVALPNNSYQFAAFLPTPTDTTKRVTIEFQGTANPFSNNTLDPFRFNRSQIPGVKPLSGKELIGKNRYRNYKEYRLNSLNQNQVMELEFIADMIFILNNSDANLYLNQGGTGAPSNSFYDLSLPPLSYTILDPHGGFQFAGFLDSPSAKDCFIIYCYGYADAYRALKQLLGQWDWYLPPLVIPGDQWYFDWQFAAPIAWCYLWDFSADFGAWYSPGLPDSFLGQFPGCCFTGSSGGANISGAIWLDIPVGFANYITGISADFEIFNDAPPGAWDFDGAGGFVGGVEIPSFSLTGIPITPTDGFYTVTTSGTVANDIEQIRIAFRTFTDRTVTIRSIQVNFFGVPFLTPNC